MNNGDRLISLTTNSNWHSKNCFFEEKKLLNPETCKFIALVTEGFISEDLYFIVETRTKKKEKETPNEMPLLNQGESVFMSY